MVVLLLLLQPSSLCTCAYSDRSLYELTRDVVGGAGTIATTGGEYGSSLSSKAFITASIPRVT